MTTLKGYDVRMSDCTFCGGIEGSHDPLVCETAQFHKEEASKYGMVSLFDTVIYNDWTYLTVAGVWRQIYEGLQVNYPKIAYKAFQNDGYFHDIFVESWAVPVFKTYFGAAEGYAEMSFTEYLTKILNESSTKSK